MELIFGNKVINASIIDIITRLRIETGNYFFEKIGKPDKEHLQVQCPFHHDGHESHMSASFYNDENNPEVEYGFFKCFTCGKKLPLYKVVNYCFHKDESDEFGKHWLIDNFGDIIDIGRTLPPFPESVKKKEKIILNESVLNDYNYIHPYMYKRKLSDPIISKYKIGYDPESDAITFPCWDLAGNLVAINRRSIKGKRFELVSDVNKEVYLLNYALQENASTVFVMESQINALSFMSEFPGTHAIALLGTGCKRQYNILNKVGIRSYILMLDGDFAGRQGAQRFIKNIKNSLIINIDMPDKKDVNDLSKEELLNLLHDNNVNICG